MWRRGRVPWIPNVSPEGLEGCQAEGRGWRKGVGASDPFPWWVPPGGGPGLQLRLMAESRVPGGGWALLPGTSAVPARSQTWELAQHYELSLPQFTRHGGDTGCLAATGKHYFAQALHTQHGPEPEGLMIC